MISLILDGVKTVFGWMAEKSKAKHDREMAGIELDKRLLQSKQRANSQWEIAQLRDKDKLIRWCAFLLYASPLISTIISPELGARVMNGWHQLTTAQAYVLDAMCLSVFGIRKITQIVSGTVGSVIQAVTDNVRHKES